MNTQAYLDKAIQMWRTKRSKAFAKHDLNVTEVYDKGEFDQLPAECLMAVCYVDAFQSMKSSMKQKGEE